jgi:tetratricopeptide (TPR) repeat protein
MICPKCGFDQPDDAYCAFCGISIKKYRQERRKKQYVVYVLVSLVVIAGIFIAVNSIRHVNPPKPVTPYAEGIREDRVGDADLQESGPDRFQARQEPVTWNGDDRQPPSESTRKAFLRPEHLEDEGPSAMEHAERLPSAEPTSDSVSERGGGEQLTARDWFEKGRALDDESESEVECYEKALALDPEFAPAYYRLGAIYFRRARYELADQEFTKFIEYASESERQTYDIYVYYSPSDMERLSATAVTEEASGDHEENEASAEATATEAEVSTEIEGEEKEAVSEIEGVEKIPEEAEEGQVETTAEAEDMEKEALEEGEITETGTSAENSERAEEDTEY